MIKLLITMMLIFSTSLFAEEPKDLTLTKNVFIVFDDSGSMDGMVNSKMSRAISATNKLIDSLDSKINLGIYALNAGIVTTLSLNDKKTNVKALVGNLRASGSTYIGDALEVVNRIMMNQQRIQASYGEYIIVIVTDGEANDANKMYQQVNIGSQKGFVYKTIGLDINQHKLQEVTKFVSASSVQDLVSQMEKAISPEIKSLQTFEPQNF